MLLDDRKPEVKLEPEVDEAGLLLTLAAGLIQESGWIQNEYEFYGAYCAFGAMEALVGGHQDGYRLLGEAACRLAGKVGGRPSDADEEAITRWNDAAGRTKEEVMEAMREAAFAAR